jgi:hypothetical protein
MAISRLSTSRLTQGLPKFQSAWDQDLVPAGAIHPIQTVSVGASGGFSFTSIPQTYTDLMIVCNTRNTAAETSGYSIVYFNGDAASTNYSRVYFYATGTSPGGAADTSYAQFYGIMTAGANSTANIFSTTIINIMGYSTTNKFKTILEKNSTDLGGSGFVMNAAGLWRSTAAITSIAGGSVQGSYAPGSTFTLYGIRS